MKKNYFLIGISLLLGWGLVCCSKSESNVGTEPDLDAYGVEIGTYENYHGTGCTVTVKKQPQVRTSFIDEVYIFSVDKPGKGTCEFFITMEEIPDDNKIVITQFDEFWNEIVAVVYTDRYLTDIIVAEDNPETLAMTRGWFGNFWNCAKMRYREVEKVIEEDDDVHFWCAIVDYAGACTISSLAISAIDCF